MIISQQTNTQGTLAISLICADYWYIWSQSHFTAAVVPYECVRACSHACDQKINSKKMPNNNCKQAQPSGKATQVCVCALPFASLCVFAIFIQRGVRPPFPPCVCAFVSFLPSLFFLKPLRQSGSHFLEDDFPGFLPSVIPSLCPASCREPRLPLSSFLLYF